MLEMILKSLLVAIVAMVPLPESGGASQLQDVTVMRGTSEPISFAAVDIEEIPDDNGLGGDDSAVMGTVASDGTTNDDVDKAWTQARKGVDELHLDAWNQDNIDGHLEPDAWFYDEPEYVTEMLGKVVSYDSDTDWAATVDTDLCRATFFHRQRGAWVAKCGWNSYQGIHRPWQDPDWDGLESETKRNWSGPRSRSFKGAWKISGRWPDGGGVSEWATSIVPCDHEKGAYGQDNCQRFEVGYGDATNTPLEQRFKTHGCTGLDTANAIWVCETIPNSTTVIVFDHVNPWPEWFEGDGSPT